MFITIQDTGLIHYYTNYFKQMVMFGYTVSLLLLAGLLIRLAQQDITNVFKS